MPVRASSSHRRRSHLGCATLLAAAALLLALVPARSASAAVFSPVPDATWGTNGRVYDVLRLGNRIYVAGSFTAVRSPTGQVVGRNRVAAFDFASGALVLEWAPNVDGTVYALSSLYDGSHVYLAGSFGNVSGVSRRNVAAINVASGAVAPWVADTNGAVRDIDVAGPVAFMGGDFTAVRGAGRGRLAAVHAATGEVLPWAPNANGQVNVVRLVPEIGEVFVGGRFTNVSGRTRFKIAAISAASPGAVVAWAPNPGYQVLDLDVGQGAVFAAIGGAGGGHAAAFNIVTGAQLWYKSGNGDAQAVQYLDGRVYLGGHFYLWGPSPGVSRPRFAVLNAANGDLDPFTINVDQGAAPGSLGIWAIAYSVPHLHIGGDFDTVSRLSRPKYTRFAQVG